jgi:hypothetical protein
MMGSDALTAVHGKHYEVNKCHGCISMTICIAPAQNTFLPQTGCIPCMLYIASGSSTDWAHGEAGIRFTTRWRRMRHQGTAAPAWSFGTPA